MEQLYDTQRKVHTRRPRAAEQGTVSYLRQVGHIISTKKDPEEIQMIVDNAAVEVEGMEASLGSHEHCSFVVEQLLRHYKAPDLRKFAKNTGGFYLHMATHRYGSHVLQTLIDGFATSLSVERPITSSEDDLEAIVVDGDQQPWGETNHGCILGMCVELEPHWSVLMREGNHFLRSLVSTLSGRKMHRKTSAWTNKHARKKKKKRKRQAGLEQCNDDTALQKDKDGADSLSKQIFIPPQQFDEVLIQLSRSIATSPANVLDKLSRQPGCSAALQHILRILKDGSKDKPSFGAVRDELVEALLHWQEVSDKGEEQLRKVFGCLAEDPVGSRLLDVLLQCCSSAHYSQIWKCCFLKNKNETAVPSTNVLAPLVRWAKHPIANFAVQQLLRSARTLKQVKAMRDELAPHIPMFLSASAHESRGGPGVVWRLVDVSSRLNPEEGGRTIIESIISALSINEGDEAGELAQQLLQISENIVTQREWKLSPTRARLVNALMRVRPASAARVIVRSVTRLPPIILSALCRDSWGGRYIVEAILQPGGLVHPTISNDDVSDSTIEAMLERARDQLAKRLLGQYVELSTDRFGAFAVEKAFLAARPKRKLAIAKELLSAERKLNGNRFGRIVMQKCNVEGFKSQPKQWFEQQQSRYKKQKELQEMLKSVDATRQDILTIPKKRQKKINTPEKPTGKPEAADESWNFLMDAIAQTDGGKGAKAAKDDVAKISADIVEKTAKQKTLDEQKKLEKKQKKIEKKKRQKEKKEALKRKLAKQAIIEKEEKQKKAAEMNAIKKMLFAK